MVKDDVQKDSTAEDATSPIPSPISIRHLVLAGGGTFGLTAYGLLRECHERGQWNIDNIQSIYGTSIGSLLAVLLSLKYEWSVLDKYLIQRPWHHVFKYDIQMIFGAFTKRGIFDIKIMEDFFEPLFSGLDIPLHITLREFYEMNGIDIHMYSTNVNSFSLVDISHTTHPDWKVVEAVYASSCLPIFFAPLCKDGEYYIDGGIFLNYPLEPCMGSCTNHDEILGVRKSYVYSASEKIHEGSTLMDYMLTLLNNMLKLITKDVDTVPLRHEYVIPAAIITAADLIKMASSEESRKEWIETGAVMASKDDQRV